eukprot:gene2000-3891_t
MIAAGKNDEIQIYTLVKALSIVSTVQEWDTCLVVFMDEKYQFQNPLIQIAFMEKAVCMVNVFPDHAPLQLQFDILNALRIGFRQEDIAFNAANIPLFHTLMSLVESPLPDVIAKDIPIAALKCFTNLLNRNAQAIRLFQDATNGINGIYRLMAVIKASRPVTVTYFAVRLLHMIAARSPFPSHPSVSVSVSLVFPFGKDRCLLAMELCSLLYVCMSSAAGEALLKGDALCKLLLLPRHDRRVFELQQRCLQLLALVPQESPLLRGRLSSSPCVTALCALLHLQMMASATEMETEIINVSASTSASESVAVRPAYLLSPILIVCTHVVEASEEGRHTLETLLLPNFPSLQLQLPEELEPITRANAPIDPPVYAASSLAARLMRLMTSLDPYVKRYAAELMFAICGCD